MNYFEILKLPIAYDIDTDLMTRNYFSLQRNSENSVDSGVLNEAYNVLKNDIRRAEYFLNLKNISTETMPAGPDPHHMTCSVAHILTEPPAGGGCGPPAGKDIRPLLSILKAE